MSKPKINYDPSDPRAVETHFWCERRQQRRMLMLCPLCEDYQCTQLSKDDIQTLQDSPLMDKAIIGLEERRIRKVYIAKFRDGRIEEVDLDPKNPDVELVSQVEEVYVVSKTLVPAITLKPKPKEERTQVESAPKASGTTTKKRTRRTAKKA